MAKIIKLFPPPKTYSLRSAKRTLHFNSCFISSADEHQHFKQCCEHRMYITFVPRATFCSLSIFIALKYLNLTVINERHKHRAIEKYLKINK